MSFFHFFWGGGRVVGQTPRPFQLTLLPPPEDFHDAFCVAWVPLDASGPPKYKPVVNAAIFYSYSIATLPWSTCRANETHYK